MKVQADNELCLLYTSGAQHLWAERDPCRAGEGKAALADPLFPHDHRPDVYKRQLQIDADDLFTADSAQLEDIRIFKGGRIDRAILYACLLYTSRCV